MVDNRSGPPSRGGFSRGPARGGSSRGGPSRGGPPSRGGSPRGDSRGGSQGGSRGGGFGGGGRDRSEGGERSFSDRPKRDFGDRPFGDRPQRNFSDRPPRREGGDRPFGDRPPRRDDRFGDRPQREGRSYEDRPQRDFGGRPQRESRSYEGRPADKAPRRDSDMPFEDRPRRNFQSDGFGASRKRDDMNTERPRDDRPKRDFGDRPKRDFGDRPPRREGGDRPFGDRPPRGDFADRAPRRDYSDRRPSARKGFDKRPDRETGEQAESAVKGHETVIYGVHAVQAALRNEKRTVKAIWVTDIGHEHLKDARDEARHPEPETMERRDIERRLPAGAVHQGVAIAVEPLDEVFLSDVLAAANAPNADRQVVVVLDEVTDPHNVGAVLRSMSMFGAKAMIVHKRNAPSITGAMAKTATGAVEHVPMVPVTNLAQALQELQNAGFYCLGLDENADTTIDASPATSHIALVLGNEGEGLRAKTRTTCDAIASIPSIGAIKSLNVSNAAAIALYTITSANAPKAAPVVETLKAVVKAAAKAITPEATPELAPKAVKAPAKKAAPKAATKATADVAPKAISKAAAKAPAKRKTTKAE